MIIAFCMAMNRVLKKQRQEQQEGKQLHIMYAVTRLIQTIFYFLRPSRGDGKAGILLRIDIMAFCAGHMMHGLLILCVMPVMAHGLQVIVSSFIQAATVAYVLKN